VKLLEKRKIYLQKYLVELNGKKGEENMITFTLDIIPEPQKQTRFAIRGGKPRCYDPSTAYKTQLQWQMKAYAPKEPFPGPVRVDYTFYLPIPKDTSWIKKQQMFTGFIFHIKKPDLDNLAYVVTNAMKDIIYKDDSQIVFKSARKMYGEKPRIIVMVQSADESQELVGNDK